VLAVSQFTKNEIEKLLAIPDRRIEVVLQRNRRAFSARPRHQRGPRPHRRALPGEPSFLLYAGAIRPHKNVVRIIEAFSALKNELRKEGNSRI